jgi:hypothetical protein
MVGSKYLGGREGMPRRIYHLFISHSWKYSGNYKRLVALLKADRYFSFRNFSVPVVKPIQGVGSDNALYQAILNKMRACHVIIVIAGVHATYSKWIDKEIEIAKSEFENPKPILAIKPYGNLNVSSLTSEADLTVNWNTASVVQAIKDLTYR